MRKSSKLAISIPFVIAALFFSAFPSISVSPPKAGAICPKVGLTKNYQGKKYTCTKSGKKLAWNKGVLIQSPVATPSATPSPSVSPSSIASATSSKPQEDLATDSLITSPGELSNTQLCKTADQTKKDGRLNGPWSNSNGFPRPDGAVNGKSEINILVYPLEFSNSFDITEDFLKRIQDSESLPKRIYENNSYGKAKLKFHYLPRELWWKSDKPLHEWNYTNRLNDEPKLEALRKIFANADKRIDFDLYDTVMMISTAGGWEGEAIFGASIKAPTGTVRNLVPSIGMSIGLFSGNWWSYFVAHELGHSLYGLEDLYLQSTSPYLPSSLIEGDSDRTRKGVQNDLMMDNVENFIGWNRFLNGWLEDSEVRCVVRQMETIHYLADLNSKKGQKLLLLSLGEGITVSAEVRIENSAKLITSLIDTRISHAYVPIRLGPILSLDSTGSSTGNLAGWRFEILKGNSEGMLFRVTRVSDFPVFAQQNGGSQTSKPKSPEDLGGQQCTKENEVVRNSEGEFWCLKLNDGLRWSKNNK